jgi:hypothetical protein
MLYGPGRRKRIKKFKEGSLETRTVGSGWPISDFEMTDKR